MPSLNSLAALLTILSLFCDPSITAEAFSSSNTVVLYPLINKNHLYSAFVLLTFYYTVNVDAWKVDVFRRNASHWYNFFHLLLAINATSAIVILEAFAMAGLKFIADPLPILLVI